MGVPMARLFRLIGRESDSRKGADLFSRPAELGSAHCETADEIDNPGAICVLADESARHIPIAARRKTAIALNLGYLHAADPDPLH